VWCARKGAALLVATMNESREWECCTCLQCAHEMCEWVVCGIWMASVEVRTKLQPTNNWQSVELRVGFTTLVAVASSILHQRNDPRHNRSNDGCNCWAQWQQQQETPQSLEQRMVIF
jgi:hypothetical protein